MGGQGHARSCFVAAPSVSLETLGREIRVRSGHQAPRDHHTHDRHGMQGEPRRGAARDTGGPLGSRGDLRPLCGCLPPGGVHIAGGIGITLIYSNRTPAGTAFHDEIVRLAQTNPNLTYVPTMTQVEAGQTWDAERRKVSATFLRSSSRRSPPRCSTWLGRPGSWQEHQDPERRGADRGASPL